MHIDAHQHFWIYDHREYDWIDDAMAALRRDFLPADLKPELERNGFQGCVAVQARQTLEETRWLLELAEHAPFILGVVGWVDLRSPRVRFELESLTGKSKLVGVRHIVQSEPEEGFLLQPDFLRGIAMLEEFDLAYDILIYTRHLPVAAVIRRAEELPRALASQVPAVFFLRAPAFHLGPLVWAVQARGKLAFVHVDLIAGLGKDRAGIAFLAREIGVNGIITSHSGLVAAAKAERVIAVQRLLLYDDLGLSSALAALDHARPDIVEVLPGVIFPLVVDQIRARLPLPMIVGGFVKEPAQRESALQRGAVAISTSTAELWG